LPTFTPRITIHSECERVDYGLAFAFRTGRLNLHTGCPGDRR
jgi:hypothetical protein